jgi:hypothetical protein
MSDLPRPRHLAALEALSGVSPGVPPNRQLRATDEVFGNLHLLNHCQRLTDDEASGTAAFQQVIEDLERQREWLRAVGEPHRYQSLAFEIGRPPNSPDRNRSAGLEDSSPDASRASYKRFPSGRFPQLVEKFKSLEPGLTRTQQYAAVSNSSEFAGYHLTDRVLREAAKLVPVPRGRPRNQKQT